MPSTTAAAAARPEYAQAEAFPGSAQDLWACSDRSRSLGGLVINNLFSLRFWIAPLFGAGLVAWLLTLPLYWIAPSIHETALMVVFVPLALALGIFMANPRVGGYYHCPKCGKGLRTNKGGTTCHHCGYDTLREIPKQQRREAAPSPRPTVDDVRTSRVETSSPRAAYAEQRRTAAMTQVAAPAATALAASTRRIDLQVPPDVAWQRVKIAMRRIGKVEKESEAARVLAGKARYGLQPIRLKVAVVPGPTRGTSVLEVAAKGDDVWGVGARKVTEKLILALG
jgi:uncharacterized Zn finger protein (UPF0148 family)